MATRSNLDRLYELAMKQRESAYAPYSSFAVGAALECLDGGVFCGCNVENTVFGLSICAERVAMFRAIASGMREFSALVVVASPLASPCGSCRQVLSEFFDDQVTIAAFEAGKPEHSTVWTMSELLPDPFRFGN